MLFTLSVNLILIVLGVFLTRSAWQKYFKSISIKTWVWLFLIFFISLGVRFYITVPHHEIYIDETWYEQAANHFVTLGNFGDYQKSIGWPFVLACFYKIFGFNYFTSIYLSSFLGALTIFPLYFLVRDLSLEDDYSLLAPIVLALSPLHIFWSATAETNVASLFFVISSLWLAWCYAREKTFCYLLLCISFLSFSSQIRGENYFFLIAFLVIITIYNRRIWLGRNLFLLLIPLVLASNNFLQIFNFTFSRNWAASDSLGRILHVKNFALANLYNNTFNFGPELFTSLSLFSIIFGLAGLLVLFYQKRAYFYYSLIILFSLWLIYFSAWLETLGGRTRFYLVFVPVFAILSVWGFAWFGAKIKKKRVIVLIIFLILEIINVYFVFQTNNNSFRTRALRLETELPILIAQEPWHSCLLVTSETKTLASEKKFNLISVRDFLLDSKKNIDENECVIFISDWYCVRRDGASQKRNCDKLKNNFKLKLINQYSLEEINYGIYAIK